MWKKLTAILVGLPLAVTLGSAAQAAKGGNSANHRAFQFWGSVESTSMDDDPLTEDSLTILVQKANGNAKRAGVVPGSSLMISVGDATRYYGAAASASDVAAGDAVKVKAKSNGVSMVAHSVKET